jgi:hypothetical protein
MFESCRAHLSREREYCDRSAVTTAGVARFVLAAIALVLAAGCVLPSDPKKQAEEIASISAEGALLAHDAAEGDTTNAFTRVHAHALRKHLAKLEPKVEADEVARLLAETDEAPPNSLTARGTKRAPHSSRNGWTKYRSAPRRSRK